MEEKNLNYLKKFLNNILEIKDALPNLNITKKEVLTEALKIFKEKPNDLELTNILENNQFQINGKFDFATFNIEASEETKSRFFSKLSKIIELKYQKKIEITDSLIVKEKLRNESTFKLDKISNLPPKISNNNLLQLLFDIIGKILEFATNFIIDLDKDIKSIINQQNNVNIYLQQFKNLKNDIDNLFGANKNLNLQEITNKYKLLLDEVRNFNKFKETSKEIFKNFSTRIKKFEKVDFQQSNLQKMVLDFEKYKNKIKDLEAKNIKINNSITIFETIMKTLNNNLRKLHNIEDLQTRVYRLENNFQFFLNKKENKNGFFSNGSFWSFFPVLVWNVRRMNINQKNKFIQNKKKLEIIYNNILKYKPLAIFIIDCGYELNFNLLTYDQIFTANKRNVLLIKKNVSYKYELIQDNAILINNNILFMYYTPNEIFKYNMIINSNLFTVIGDLNLKTRKDRKQITYRKIKKLNPIGEMSGQTVFLNCKFTKKSELKIINVPRELSDHDAIFLPIYKLIFKKKILPELKINKIKSNLFTTLITKNLIDNKPTYELYEKMNNQLKKYTPNETKNIKHILYQIKNLTDNFQNSFEKLVKTINHKIKFNYLNHFQTLRKLLKYTNREKFIGTKLDKKLIYEFNTISFGYLCDNYINFNSHIYKILNDEKLNSIIYNYLNKNKSFENLNQFYKKIRTTAPDNDYLNIYNVNKLIKKLCISECYSETAIIKNPANLWKKLSLISLNFFRYGQIAFKTFFLDKDKKEKNIDNYRIISISPTGLKLFEEINYELIYDVVENKIKKYTFNNQFGFLKKYNCNVAITKAQKFKNNIILIDLYRAYEQVQRELLKNFLEKKIIKLNVKINDKKNNKNKKQNVVKKYIAYNLIYKWLLIIEKIPIKLNNKFIYTSRGVTMGSRWSPIIFNFFLAIILKDFIYKWSILKKDMNIIMYADDIILDNNWSNSVIILQEIFAILNSYNIKINFNKCEIIYDVENPQNLNKSWTIYEILRKWPQIQIKKTARYLGKWLKSNESGIIITGNDILKEIGNKIYIKDLSWEIKIMYIHLYIISKRRYNIMNELNTKYIFKLISEIRRNIVAISNYPNISYWETLEIIGFRKIILQKIIYNEFLLKKDDNNNINSILISENAFFIIEKMFNILYFDFKQENNIYFRSLIKNLYYIKKNIIDDKANILHITLNNIKNIDYKISQIICNLGEKTNNNVLLSFLLDKNLRKIENLRNWSLKDIKEEKYKSKYLVATLILIYESICPCYIEEVYNNHLNFVINNLEQMTDYIFNKNNNNWKEITKLNIFKQEFLTKALNLFYKWQNFNIFKFILDKMDLENEDIKFWINYSTKKLKELLDIIVIKKDKINSFKLNNIFDLREFLNQNYKNFLDIDNVLKEINEINEINKSLKEPIDINLNYEERKEKKLEKYEDIKLAKAKILEDYDFKLRTIKRLNDIKTNTNFNLNNQIKLLVSNNNKLSTSKKYLIYSHIILKTAENLTNLYNKLETNNNINVNQLKDLKDEIIIYHNNVNNTYASFQKIIRTLNITTLNNSKYEKKNIEKNLNFKDFCDDIKKNYQIINLDLLKKIEIQKKSNVLKLKKNLITNSLRTFRKAEEKYNRLNK